MKALSKFILAILSVSLMTVACDDMNTIIQDDLDKGEKIYPGRNSYSRLYDVDAGIGRVWLYWALTPDTRVVKSVVTYTFNGETQSVEKPVSAINDGYEYIGYRSDSLEITGLDEGFYSFSVHTVDMDGNRSISTQLYGRAGEGGLTEVVQVYGDIYLNSLPARGIEKMEILPGGDLQLTWSTSIDTLIHYSVLEYRDHSQVPSGISTVDTVYNDEPVTILQGFKRFKTFSIKSYRQVGLDLTPIEDFLAPPVVEKALLETAPNTFTDLTEEKANAVTELTYPFGIAGWTLQDLYYFPNLKKLDLTPGTDVLPELTYDKYYTDRVTGTERFDTIKYKSTTGNCPWINFVSGYMRDSDIAIIADLLESGQLTEIKYTRNSYPKLDAVLEPYGSSIKWNPVEPISDYGIMIPNSLLVDYRVVDRDKGINLAKNVTYSETGSNIPAAIAEKFEGDKLNNVYKVVMKSRRNDSDGGSDAEASDNRARNTIAFAIPPGYQFGFVPNAYIKFDCYIEVPDPEYSWFKPGNISRWTSWQTIKFFHSRKLPSAPEDPDPYVADDFPYGSPNRNETRECLVRKDVRYSVAEADLGKWASFSVTINDDGGNKVADLESGHYRVLRIQFGGSDDGTPWALPTVSVNNVNQAQTLTYYIANLRWAK